VVPVAATVEVAVNGDGRREIFGTATGTSEAEVFWTDFLRSLAMSGFGQPVNRPT
jgi:putative transposase